MAIVEKILKIIFDFMKILRILTISDLNFFCVSFFIIFEQKVTAHSNALWLSITGLL